MFGRKRYRGTVAHIEDDGEYIIYFASDHSTIKTKLPDKHTKILERCTAHFIGDIFYVDNVRKFGIVFDNTFDVYYVFFPITNSVHTMQEKDIKKYKQMDTQLLMSLKNHR